MSQNGYSPFTRLEWKKKEDHPQTGVTHVLVNGNFIRQIAT